MVFKFDKKLLPSRYPLPIFTDLSLRLNNSELIFVTLLQCLHKNEELAY